MALQNGDYGHILLDELHKLFQTLDSGKGYLEVSEILDFQASIAESKITFFLNYNFYLLRGRSKVE